MPLLNFSTAYATVNGRPYHINGVPYEWRTTLSMAEQNRYYKLQSTVNVILQSNILCAFPHKRRYVNCSSYSELYWVWFTTKWHQQYFCQLVQEWYRCKQEGLDGLLQGLTGPLGPLITIVLWIHLHSRYGHTWLITWWVCITYLSITLDCSHFFFIFTNKDRSKFL